MDKIAAKLFSAMYEKYSLIDLFIYFATNPCILYVGAFVFCRLAFPLLLLLTWLSGLFAA